MIRKYLPVITDTVFFTFSVFLILTSALIRLVPTAAAFVLSATISLCFGVFVFRLLSFKRGEKYVSEKEKADAELYLLQFSFMNPAEISGVFKHAFDNAGKKTVKIKNAFRCIDENVLYMPCFNVGGTEKADVVKLFNMLTDNERGKIFSLSVSDEVKAFADRFGNRIELICGNKAYKFLKENAALPKIRFTPAKKKPKRFDFNVIFNKKRAKKYFLFGSTFAVMSFFIRFGVYYIVAGCLFLALAAATAIFGKTPPKEEI